MYAYKDLQEVAGLTGWRVPCVFVCSDNLNMVFWITRAVSFWYSALDDLIATEPQLSESTKRLYTLLSTLHNLTPLPPALAGDGDTFAMKNVDVCIPGNALNSPDSPSPTPHLLATT